MQLKNITNSVLRQKNTNGSVVHIPTSDAALTFQEYVRTLVAELLPILNPSVRKEIERYLEPFLKYMNLLRDERIPTARFILKTEKMALPVLTAIYISTRTLIRTLSPAEIEQQAKDGTLTQTLRWQAEQEARRQRIGLEDAQKFGELYAESVLRHLQTLKVLAAK